MTKKKTVVICSAVALMVIFALGSSYVTHMNQSNAASHVYSHRGASGEETEHTFAAYDLAIQYGSEYIEQDVVVSKDKTLFVSHDLSAQRLTGVDALYSDLTDDEIEALSTKDGQKILRLAEVFERYTDSIHYVVELKSDADTVEQFITLVNSSGLAENIIVQSLEPEVLQTVEDAFPNMPKLLLVTNEDAFQRALGLDCADIISVDKALMNKENCALTHEHHKSFNVWTLNSTEEIKRAIELGVDTYFTNFTAKALLLERQYSRHSR